jgi:arabinofuranosyltransferase
MKRTARIAGILFVGLIGPLIFLLQEKRIGLWGFPLDDGWIHQTYARSLAAGQGWAYAGGPPSAGSTSPLWTILQIPSFWLHLPPIEWSYGLGILFLLLNAVLLTLWIRKMGITSFLFGLIFALGEWHLVWASLSGMETLLFCCWVSFMFFLFFPLSIPPDKKELPAGRLFLLGILSGAGIWIRPEALLLLAYIGVSIAIQLYPTMKRRFWPFFIGSFLPVVCYFWFNLGFSGRPFPNTFYVKTAEYAAWTSQSIFLRFLQALVPLLAGPVIALIPFLVAAVFLLLRSRKFLVVLPFAWALSHILLYAIRLPATYQHGRYFLPVLPVLIGYGIYGYSSLREKALDRLIPRIALRVTWASALLLTGIFLFLGAAQFSADVKFVQTNTVDMALWIRQNTPGNAVIAAHDIGALGFWGDRRIVDLGGVTDLDALPLLSGKTVLENYLRLKHADLLMTFAATYALSLDACIPVHTAEEITPLSIERMMLFEWRLGCFQQR